MGPINLDVFQHEDLYSAWNAQQVQLIEDYNSKEVAGSFYVPPGDPHMEGIEQHPPCIKETYIEKLPKTLIFQLGRVEYNKTQKCLVKNSKPFFFEKVIYADRFMKDNHSSQEAVKKRIQVLREQER